MQRPALVIMAAGLGSRYGGLKQAEPVGPHGELIIDYSIHDAMKAGFGRVICIIKPENREIFEERIGRRHSEAKIEYAYQRMTDLPEGYAIPEGRQKPWGTAHAVLCCAGMLKEPFAVINADDYYGPEPFEELYRFLTTPRQQNGKYQLCMAGYRLVNTLSEKGTVARGVCTVDENGRLTDIDERMKIGWTPDGRIADMNCEPPKEYAPQTPVSMNCWGCPVELMQEFAPRFVRFLDTMHDPLKSEYLLPEVIGALLREGRAEVTVLPVHNKWYGVTYREDHEKVVAAMAALTAEGLYPEVLK